MTATQPPPAAPDVPGDFMADVRARACFNLGPQMRRALALQKKLRGRVLTFEAYLNAPHSGGTLLLAAAVDQILRSAAPGGSWFDNAEVPPFDDLVDELTSAFGGHDGVAMKNAVLAEFRRERAKVEASARALVIYLESPPFLAEFNNAHASPSPVVSDAPYYDALAQLYFANLFSLYLTETDEGMAFFKRSVEHPLPVGPIDPPANLPVYHTSRFHACFPLEPDAGDLTFDNYDPATGTFNLDTIGLLKGLGDGVAAAYLSYHATTIAALVQLAEMPSSDRIWAGRVVYTTLELLGADVGDEAADVVLHWEFVVDHRRTVHERLKQAAPWVAASATAILALVGTWVGAQKYTAEPDPGKKITHLLEATKEVVALGAAMAETLNAARQGLGRPVVNGMLAAAARKLNLASSAVDLVMNGQQFVRDLYYNTDQAPATIVKVAGSTIGLMAFGWSVATGVSLAGPVGVAAAVLVMSMVLIGTALEAHLADTYLERFLNRGVFGPDRGSTDDPAHLHYRFDDLEMQFSAYLRLLLGVRMEARAWTVEVGGEEHTRYWVDIQTNHPLPTGTRIRLTQAGVRTPVLPAVLLEVRDGPPSNWNPGVTESWRVAAPWTGEYVCEGMRYNRPQPIPGDHVEAWITAEIAFTDEATRVVLQSLLSAATGTAPRHIPITRPVKLYVTAELKDIDD